MPRSADSWTRGRRENRLSPARPVPVATDIQLTWTQSVRNPDAREFFPNQLGAVEACRNRTPRSNHGETGLSGAGTEFDKDAGALRAHVEVDEVGGEKQKEGVLTEP